MPLDKNFSWKQQNLPSLDGLKVLVIGGTGGLGRAVSQVLATAGASVTVVGQTFRDGDTPNIDFVQCDLSSIKSAKQLAMNLDVSQTDMVLFTTGIFASTTKEVTAEGLEKDMAVSFLNRLVIIRELAPRLKTTKSVLGFVPRVFYMAYPGDGQLGHPDDLNSDRSYGAMKAHTNTVAGNEALVYYSAGKDHAANFFGLSPGIVRTGIRDNLLGQNSWRSWIVESVVSWFTRTPEQYAQGIAPLLVAPELDNYDGGIFNNVGQALQRSKGMTDEYAARYIEAADELLALKGLA